MTFTTDNWNTAQTITVTAGEDADPLDDIGLLSHFASGGDYLLRQTLPVTITDDDTATPVTVETAADELETLEIPSVTLTSPVAGRIVVTWTPPTDVGPGLRHYYLQWRKVGFAWNHTNQWSWVAKPHKRRYVINKLEAGVAYEVAIRTTSTSGTKGPFKFAEITVSDIVVPDDTTITTDVSVSHITHDDVLMFRGSHAQLPFITLTSDKTGKIDVSWGAANLIYPFPQTGFNINWAKADENYPGSSASDGWTTADGDVRSLTLSGLDTGVAYKVRVQSVNPSCCGHGNNWTGAWKEATITVASTTTVRIPGVQPAVTAASLSTPSSRLAAGELPTAAFVSTAGGEITLRWTKPRSTNQGSFKEYRVSWVPNDGSAYPGLTASDNNALVAGVDTTTYTITGLETGEYKVRVAARFYTSHSSHRYWYGPWREAVILVSEPPPPEQEEETEPEFAFQNNQELSTAAKALTHANVVWDGHLGTPHALASHDRVRLQWNKLDAHPHVYRYLIWRKAPDDASYTLHATRQRHNTLDVILELDRPRAGLRSRFYHIDRDVTPETSYDYVVQADFRPDLDHVDAQAEASVPPVAGHTNLPTLNLQSSTLISNVGQARNQPVVLGEEDGGVAFSTGNETGGYVLTSVELALYTHAEFSSIAPTVRLRSGSATGTVLHTFTLSPGYTAPGSQGVTDFARYVASTEVVLDAGTTYWITASGGGLQWESTASHSEDSGGSTNWSIANEGLIRNRGDSVYTAASDQVLKLRLSGYTTAYRDRLQAELNAALNRIATDLAALVAERNAKVEAARAALVAALPSPGLTEPIELKARTTEHLDVGQGRTLPRSLEITTEGHAVLPVGLVISVTPPIDNAIMTVQVALEANEAYRLVVYDTITNYRSHGHPHHFTTGLPANPYAVNYVHEFSMLGHEETLIDPRVPTDHDRHVDLYSIERKSDNQRIHAEGVPVGPENLSVTQPHTGDLFVTNTSGRTGVYVFHAPTAGDYVLTFYSGHRGTVYRMFVEQIDDQPEVPSWANPVELVDRNAMGRSGPQATVIGNISPGDADWFLVPLNANKSYDLRVVTNLPPNDDYRLRQLIVGDEFRDIPRWQGLSNARFMTAGRDGVVRAAPSFVRIRSDEAGYYHFGVKGASASDVGLYVLQIRERS